MFTGRLRTMTMLILFWAIVSLLTSGVFYKLILVQLFTPPIAFTLFVAAITRIFTLSTCMDEVQTWTMLPKLIIQRGKSYAWSEETLKGMFSTSAWTTTDWYVYGQMALMTNVALNVMLGLVLTFIGLYVGSMLRKPTKS